MKKTVIVMFIFLWGSALLADEIHLNDGQVIRGKILKVTERTIEYDPEGDEPFDVFPRGQIMKIVYDSGRTVNLNEGAEPIEKPLESRGTGEAAASEKKGAHRHDGFFLRAQLGFGGGATVIEELQGDDFETSGASTTFNFQLGYAIFDNFILFLENGASFMPESKVNGPGRLPRRKRRTMSPSRLLESVSAGTGCRTISTSLRCFPSVQRNTTAPRSKATRREAAASLSPSARNGGFPTTGGWGWRCLYSAEAIRSKINRAKNTIWRAP